MTEVQGPGDERFFSLRADSGSAGERDPDAIGSNAVRALLLGLMLSDAQDAMFGLNREFEAAGISRNVRAVHGWEERLTVGARSERILTEYDIPLRLGGWPGLNDPTERDFSAERIDLWSRVGVNPSDPATAVAWLRLVMRSAPDAPDGVAAAAALSHWRRPDKRAEVPGFLLESREILKVAEESRNPVAREIARGARRTGISMPHAYEIESGYPVEWEDPDKSEELSTMIHGTFAWRGDWWYPGGDFHEFVKEGVRPNVYSGGAPFSWSGGYVKRSREIAADRLARWVAEMANNQVDSVFAHSYGGAIALASTAHGAKYERMILLSVPVHNDYDIEWRNIGRKPQSVRLGIDLALTAARARQRFGANVDEHILPLQPWRHGATHDPQIWRDYKIGSLLGL